MTDSNTKDLSQITDLSEMIEKLKKNPEIVSSVVTALGLGSQVLPSVGDEQPGTPEVPSAVAAATSDKGRSGRTDDNRAALLIALKPYLSAERQEIIDYILKFSKLGEMLMKLK